MNILKEKIKLFVANPFWRRDLYRIKKTDKMKILLIGTPMHGNLGDHAIASQEEYFFKDCFPEYDFFEILMPMYHTQKEKIRDIVRENDLIVISGGGWMGNLWLHNENVIREIINDYPNNKIVLFPQTAYYTSDADGKKELKTTIEIFAKHTNLRIFVRDKKTFNLISQQFELSGASTINMAPDMVLYGKNICADEIEPADVINICLRNDCEALQADSATLLNELKKKYKLREVSTVINSPVVLKKRKESLSYSWGMFKSARLTVTDRLHAMIFSVINGTPCIVLDNRTGKVFGVAEWLEDTGMIIKAKSTREVLDNIEYGLNLQHKNYERQYLSSYFLNMVEVIRKD